MINKKGSSLSGLTEMILGLVAIMLVIAVIVVSLNGQYSKDYNPTFGIASNETLNSFKSYQGDVQTGMAGEAATNQINGISLTSSWGLIKAGLNLVFGFINGQWIQNAINLMQLGAAGNILALILRLLLVFAIGFILLTILFKIKP